MARRQPADPRQVIFQPSDDANGHSLAKPRTRPAPNRTKAERWTNLINTGTRFDEITLDRLTNACKRTGLGVQGVWETAINFYCDLIGIPDELPLDNATTPLPRPSEAAADPSTLKLVTARLKPLTRARLFAGCQQEEQGGQEFIPAALNAWFDHLDESTPL